MKENTPISNQDPNSFPPLKKVDSILKPKKTTRTMNPDSGDTMKHRTMLGRSAQVSFKERVTRSSSKKGGSVMDMDEEGCDEGVLKSGGDGDDVSIMDEAELIFGSICKDPKVSVNANVSGMPGVSVDSATVNANVSNKPNVNVNSTSINGIPMSNSGCMPEIPVPFDENPILNSNTMGSQSTSGKGSSLNEVRVPGMFKIVGDGSMLKKGIGSVSIFEVGGQGNNVGSGVSKSGSLKQSVSFASVVAKSFSGFGNNKLKYVTTTLNDEGREVAVMDPVLEEGVDKWSMTVNHEKDRLSLWRNLDDHNSIAGGHPWVLIEDFNVTLFDNENTNVNVIGSYLIRDFKKCVESLNAPTCRFRAYWPIIQIDLFRLRKHRVQGERKNIKGGALLGEWRPYG
ncbi:hypothetical protein Tco_1162213 [Tanacetum coccineum]